jgi:hypothetical protein
MVFTNAGSSTIRRMSAAIFATTASGVPAGARMHLPRGDAETGQRFGGLSHLELVAAGTAQRSNTQRPLFRNEVPEANPAN